MFFSQKLLTLCGEEEADEKYKRKNPVTAICTAPIKADREKKTSYRI